MKDVEEIVRGFLKYLVSSGKEDLLPAIIEKLQDISAEEKRTAYVTSAVPLTQEEKRKVKEYLSRNFDRDLSVKIKIDPEIIGGIKIVVGDKVIDQTILGRLDSLKEKLEG